MFDYMLSLYHYCFDSFRYIFNVYHHYSERIRLQFLASCICRSYGTSCPLVPFIHAICQSILRQYLYLNTTVPQDADILIKSYVSGVIIRSRKSKKNIQHNSKQENNNDLQNTTQKTIDWETRTHKEQWVDG